MFTKNRIFLIMIEFKELLLRSITFIILTICFCGSYFHSFTLFALFLTIALLIILFYEWPKILPISFLLWLPISIVYPILPTILLILIAYFFRNTDFFLPMYPFALSVAADTGGYITGKLIGYHKICPTISPGKSWEGLMGSWISVSITHFLLNKQINVFKNSSLVNNYWSIFLFSFLITIIAFGGGFFISILKRQQGLKDSGSLLPGHGGILDRADSVLAVGIAISILILILI